jgi:hypothetical protein
MTWMLMNIPLAVVFVALWVGVPLWLVLKHPDEEPKLAAAPAVRALPQRPAPRHEDAAYRRVA